MALQSIRYGGGVWRQQEETRVELQRRLEHSNAMLRDAKVEIDRVHAQCVMLLKDKNELKVNLNKAETQLRRQDEELQAAKQNVGELMVLLTQANEDRERLERERVAATKQWHCVRDQQKSTTQDLEQIQKQYEASESEAQRLRDLLYEAQESNEFQQHELEQLRRQVKVLVHSNQAKDSQVVALVRERDRYAQKLAHYRSRIVEGKPLSRDERTSLTSAKAALAERSSDEVTWTEKEPSNGGESTPERSMGYEAVVTFERQTQRLRAAALQAKARFERERESNAALQKRVEALEKSHDELLVRFREASKARRHIEAAVKAVECTENGGGERSRPIEAA